MLDVTIHDLRRTRITDVTKAHGQTTAQLVAGHTNQQTTAGYFAPDVIRIDLSDLD